MARGTNTLSPSEWYASGGGRAARSRYATGRLALRGGRLEPRERADLRARSAHVAHHRVRRPAERRVAVEVDADERAAKRVSCSSGVSKSTNVNKI